jgi:asparagine synthase (glutamine-hydrolysing)
MFVEALPRLIYHYDQPISFASSVALHFVSKLAKEHRVKVILTGEGADELFTGYSRYKRLQHILTITQGHGFPLGPTFFNIASKFLYDPRYIKMLAFSLKENNYDYLTGVNAIIEKKNNSNPLRATVKRLFNDGSGGINWASEDDILKGLLYLDWYTYLQELLTKQDRMSMSVSIESRVPYLDNEVIDFANSAIKIPGKYLLKAAAKSLLPENIIKRKKIGFTVPLDQWFRGPLYDYLQKELNNDIVYEYFGKEYVTTLLRQQKNHNCSLQLWAILNFKLWHDLYFKNG